MYSLLAVVPVLGEAELRQSLIDYREVYYSDLRIYVPNLDELEACLRWMSFNSNGQFFNFDIVRAFIDKDEETASRVLWVLARMRASAEHYVQLWHYKHGVNKMTTESLEEALKSIHEYHHHDDLNLGALFWAEGAAPDFLRVK